jgi:hypothetical protein
VYSGKGRKRMMKEKFCTMERGGGRRNVVQWKEERRFLFSGNRRKNLKFCALVRGRGEGGILYCGLMLRQRGMKKEFFTVVIGGISYS